MLYGLSDVYFGAVFFRKSTVREGNVLFTCEKPVHYTARNHLCMAYTAWQVKGWDKVWTKK